MAFLTSHAAPDDTNAREQMMDFWSKAVAHAYEHASGLSLDPGLTAKGSLAWHGATAPGLTVALRSLIATGKLVHRAEIEVCVNNVPSVIS